MARLILIFLLFLLSLLTVFPAPEFHVWYLAILVTEFPWIFICLTAVSLLLPGAGYKLPGTLFAIIALGLFIWPVIGAYRVGATLNNELSAAYGNLGNVSNSGRQPFHLLKMITGINSSKINFQTIAYDTIDNIPLHMDVYSAVLKERRPCVIVIHGGSWSGGDNKQLPELNSHLALKGYQVVSIEYRLAPKFLSPAPVEDVQHALGYLKQHANAFNIDTSKFILLGRSAGAQIALIAAYTLKDKGIKGAINFYGPSAMVWGYANPANPLVLNSCKVMEDYLGGTYQQVPGKYVASSPADIPIINPVPTLTIHGKIDPLVAYGHTPRLDKKLRQYGIKYYTLTLPWATHGCDYTVNGPSGQLSTYAIERFLEIVCR
jgi:acetyl esterase/lipase